MGEEIIMRNIDQSRRIETTNRIIAVSVCRKGDEKVLLEWAPMPVSKLVYVKKAPLPGLDSGFTYEILVDGCSFNIVGIGDELVVWATCDIQCKATYLNGTPRAVREFAHRHAGVPSHELEEGTWYFHIDAYKNPEAKRAKLGREPTAEDAEQEIRKEILRRWGDVDY